MFAVRRVERSEASEVHRYFFLYGYLYSTYNDNNISIQRTYITDIIISIRSMGTTQGENILIGG